jgi:hypothetical protein
MTRARGVAPGYTHEHTGSSIPFAEDEQEEHEDYGM